MTSSIKDKFAPSAYATFDRNRKHSFDRILEIANLVYYRVFSRDVTGAMLVSLNKGTVAVLVFPTNPPEICSYATVFSFFWLRNMLINHMSENTPCASKGII